MLLFLRKELTEIVLIGVFHHSPSLWDVNSQIDRLRSGQAVGENKETESRCAKPFDNMVETLDLK